jgi:hypothetical protein
MSESKKHAAVSRLNTPFTKRPVTAQDSMGAKPHSRAGSKAAQKDVIPTLDGMDKPAATTEVTKIEEAPKAEEPAPVRPVTHHGAARPKKKAAQKDVIPTLDGMNEPAATIEVTKNEEAPKAEEPAPLRPVTHHGAASKNKAASATSSVRPITRHGASKPAAVKAKPEVKPLAVKAVQAKAVQEKPVAAKQAVTEKMSVTKKPTEAAKPEVAKPAAAKPATVPNPSKSPAFRNQSRRCSDNGDSDGGHGRPTVVERQAVKVLIAKSSSKRKLRVEQLEIQKWHDLFGYL